MLYSIPQIHQGLFINNSLVNWTDWGDEYDEDYDYNDDDDSHGRLLASKKSLNHAAMVIYSLIFLLGVPGNVVVIWFSVFRMSRRPNTVWFVNLAIADLICCLSLPFLISQLAMDFRWPFGWFLCKVLPSATVLSMFASVFVLTGISVDRCLVTVFPVWSRTRRTAAHVTAACGCAWALALLMCLPSFLYRRTVTAGAKLVCSNEYGDRDAAERTNRAIQVTRFVFGFLLPFLLIGACYTVLLLTVRGARFRWPRRFYRLILFVVLGFFVCWLPYHVVGLLLTSRDEGLRHRALVVDPFITSLAYMNSCVNPFLYVFVGRSFKEQLRRSLREIFEGAFDEETSSLHRASKGAIPSVCEQVATGGTELPA